MRKQNEAKCGEWPLRTGTSQKVSSRVAYDKSTSCTLNSSILPSTTHISMPFPAFEVPGSILPREFSASKAESFSER